jgi:hypothetical protein
MRAMNNDISDLNQAAGAGVLLIDLQHPQGEDRG